VLGLKILARRKKLAYLISLILNRLVQVIRFAGRLLSVNIPTQV